METQLKTVSVYDEYRQKVGEVKEACNFLADVSTEEGYARSKRVSLDVGKILTALETSRKEAKADSLAFGRLIDSEAKDLAETLKGFQEPHKLAYKELDEAKKERDRRRKESLEQRVRDMRDLPDLMRDSDAEGVKMALERLNSDECLDYYEYTEQALKARNASKEALGKMFADKFKQERDAKELAELRKKQAEHEQREREAKIAQEAKEKADREAAEKAEVERQRVEKEKQEIIARGNAAKLEAEQAEQRHIAAEAKAQRDVKEAKEKATREAKEASERAEREKQEAIENERRRVEAQDRAKAEALAKREANNKHVSAILKAAKEALMKQAGLSEANAKKIVLAITNGKIPAVFITY